MEIDPHTLQQILQRIKQQMRCPQCGKRVPVDFSSVRIVADSSMLLQLKCEMCNAFIVLHASLQGIEHLQEHVEDEDDTTINASSTLQMSENELAMLNAALEQSDGSFEKMFQKYGPETSENSDS